ncbi:MAG: hypothetical protein A2X94_14765 [Bdellovibrionales bacterium GWB1_55_8]|nr:MAG: hypothetical protein A2X94_14765 [Bdellovibrionales bacterium GWB1_55_8]
MQLVAAKSELINRMESLQQGDHLCLLHDTESRWREFVASFVAGGLKRRERVVLLSGVKSPYSVMELLREEGLEPSNRIYNGQLVILPAQDLDSARKDHSSSFFNPEQVLDFLSKEMTRARLDGFAGLRVSGDLTSVANAIGGERPLLVYEAKLADFFSTHSAIVACQYDRNVFSDEFLLSVIDLHPIVVLNGSVLENRVFYSPYHESSGPAAASYKFQSRLRILEELNAVEQQSGQDLAWMQRLAASLPAGIFLMDPLGNCTYINKEWTRITGMDLEAAVGMGWMHFIDPEDDKVIISNWTQAIEKGVDFEGEFRTRKIHGRVVPGSASRWVSVRVSTLRGDRGEIMGYLGILQDVSARMESLSELRESKRWMSSVFRALPTPVSIVELESGKYLDINDAFEDLAGMSRYEILGKTAVELGFSTVLEFSHERELCMSSVPGCSIASVFRARSGLLNVQVSASLVGSRAGPCILSVLNRR